MSAQLEYQRRKYKEGWRSFNVIRPPEIIKLLKELDARLYTEYKIEKLKKKLKENE